MITPLSADAPIPDGIALRAGLQLPPRVQAAVGLAAQAARLFVECRGPQYAEARQNLQAELRAANKILAAHDPRLVTSWADLPGLDHL
ncbi:MAG: hypothetical protein HOW59_29560 [Nonomuraea sp.]|nr:hypothetical protein [Nonomuraea sp.]NUS89413.1 hypothetical protein [Streptomyces sp.]